MNKDKIPPNNVSNPLHEAFILSNRHSVSLEEWHLLKRGVISMMHDNGGNNITLEMIIGQYELVTEYLC